MVLAKSFLLFGFLALVPLFGGHKFNAHDVAASTRALSWSTTDDQGVKTRGNHCTAFKVEGRWLTAGHCVLDEAAGELLNRDYEVEGMPMRAFRADQQFDIAQLMPEVVDVSPSLDLAKQAPDYGDFVAVVGHPYGWPEWIVQVGTVSNPGMAFGVLRMTMNVTGAPGDSGSSVVNDRGQVVGILVAGFCWSPFGDSGFCPESAAVTWGQVKAFLEAH